VIRLVSSSAEETRDLAAVVAGFSRAGDLILVSGDLGAGKTVFAQGFGRGLGVVEPVTSPTFTLVRTYEANPPLIHADVYRLDRLQEVIDLGLNELVDRTAVALIEWGDVAAATFTSDYLLVRIGFEPDADDIRHFELVPVGPGWTARSRALSGSLSSWLVAP
jgi:tRNA threonylcarbamoyladenosine biosynthesis protein TsaE